MATVIVMVVMFGVCTLMVVMDMVVVMDTVMVMGTDMGTDMVGVTRVGDTTLLIIQGTTLLTIRDIMNQLPMAKDTLTIQEELVVAMAG